MPHLKEQLNGALLAAVRLDAVAGAAAPLAADRAVFGPTKNPAHGDLATNAAMVVAKPLGKNPAEVAEKLAGQLRAHPLIESAEVAKPGFVNIRLSTKAFASILQDIVERASTYGHMTPNSAGSILLEFVSANPTGPMHIGHCRHAATGDSLCRILQAAGHKVGKEFYINDAGVQLEALGRSFRFRCFEAVGLLGPGDVQDDGEKITFQGETISYPGDYLKAFAEDFVANKCKEEIGGLTPSQFAWEARNRNLQLIVHDLAAMGVAFDNYVSEQALRDSGAVERALDALTKNGMTYEKDGALWLRTQDFGDNEDRVLRKKDGALTYMVPDIAYHLDKYQRHFDQYLNIFGADHGGYPPRLRAGIAGVGEDEKKLTVLLLRLVFLIKHGHRVKFSKRAGNFVALSDVVEEAGADATRWFMLCRSIDSEFEFDMDLATQHTSQNPVFKVQYAHARICSLTQKGLEAHILPSTDATVAAALLTAPIEREMLLYIAQFPEMIERSAKELSVHNVPAYVLGLADLWNRYWTMAKTDDSFRVINSGNRDLSQARMLLANCVRQTLANGLSLMGITAPQRMERDEEDAS
ncbi:arginine--tRNA ligase [Candidatus Sumerlaeota bacterium]|nr:arginine--tRNA ligase [Candidatus Sumerlaeota bacterium]